MAEEPVVQKRARVREEVVVGKETKQRTEQVRDTVRRTEVEVEQLGKGGADYQRRVPPRLRIPLRGLRRAL